MTVISPQKSLPFTFESTSRNVVTVRLDGGAGSEWWFLLRSDAHHDNPECDRDIEYKHLGEAVDRGAGIIDNGDLFCAMQGRYDKRSDKSKLRPEHKEGNYLDRLVATTADDYSKYAQNWVLLGQGNHETGVLKRHETNLTERLAERLNEKAGSHIHAGGYSNWVRFMCNRDGHQTSRLYYGYHGTGGGGPVTRGVIQTNRLSVFTPDADIVHSAHTHDSWQVPIARHRITQAGVIKHDEQLHVRTAGYKDGWGDGYGGFEVEKMLGPKPKDAAWLHFTMLREGVDMEVLRAR